MSLHQLDDFISSTASCNLRCIHCFPEGLSGQPLKVEERIDVYKYFAKKGVRKIVITGGEPTTALGFYDLVRAADKLFKSVAIQMNGTVFVDLTEFKNVAVVISLESGDPRYNDFIRGRGHYKDALNNIGRYKASIGKDRISIRSTITEGCAVNTLIELAKKLSIGLVGVRFHESGVGKVHKKLAASRNKMAEAYELFNSSGDERILLEEPQYYLINRNLKTKYLPLFLKQGSSCMWGHRVSMNLVGDCYMCPFSMGDKRFFLGNSMVDDFEHIENNMYRIIRERNKRMFKQDCISCPDVKACGGGCSLMGWDEGLRGDDKCPIMLKQEDKNG